MSFKTGDLIGAVVGDTFRCNGCLDTWTPCTPVYYVKGVDQHCSYCGSDWATADEKGVTDSDREWLLAHPDYMDDPEFADVLASIDARS